MVPYARDGAKRFVVSTEFFDGAFGGEEVAAEIVLASLLRRGREPFQALVPAQVVSVWPSSQILGGVIPQKLVPAQSDGGIAVLPVVNPRRHFFQTISK